MIFEEYCLHGIGLGTICEKLNGDLERYPPPKRNPKDEMPLPRRGVGRSFKPCSETPKYTGARTPSALRPSPGAPSGSGGSRSFVPPAHREAEDALEVEQAVAVLIEMHGVLRLVAQASSDAGLRRVRQLGVGGETMEAVELVNARAGVVQDAVHYVAPPRRVRKFGRGRFAGESCRRPGRRDWRIGWPPSRWRRPVHPSPSGLERKARPAERRRTRRPEHRLDREINQRREGRANLAVTGHPDNTEKSWLTLTHPLESLSFVRRHAKLRPRYRRPRVQDFPGNPSRPSLQTLRLRLAYRRLLGEQGGEPLRLSICQQQWVLLVSWPSALLLAHPVALVAAHHAGPALDLHEVDPRRPDYEQVDLVDRSVGGDELEERERAVGIVIREPLANVVERLPLPREMRRRDLRPPARIRPHQVIRIFGVATALNLAVVFRSSVRAGSTYSQEQAITDSRTQR